MKSGKLKGVRTSSVSELPAESRPTRRLPPWTGVPLVDGPEDRLVPPALDESPPPHAASSPAVERRLAPASPAFISSRRLSSQRISRYGTSVISQAPLTRGGRYRPGS